MIELILNRRSCRRYLNKDIESSVIKKIIDCGRAAPFGGKPIPECQVAEYIVVKDKNIKEKLALQYEDRQFIKDAPAIIAVLANKNNDPKYKEYILSASLSIGNMIIAAETLGLGSCVLSCFMNHKKHEEDKDTLRKALELPDNIELVCLLALGYRDNTEKIPNKQLSDYNNVVHMNTYINKNEKFC